MAVLDHGHPEREEKETRRKTEKESGQQKSESSKFTLVRYSWRDKYTCVCAHGKKWTCVRLYLKPPWHSPVVLLISQLPRRGLILEFAV